MQSKSSSGVTQAQPPFEAPSCVARFERILEASSLQNSAPFMRGWHAKAAEESPLSSASCLSVPPRFSSTSSSPPSTQDRPFCVQPEFVLLPHFRRAFAGKSPPPAPPWIRSLGRASARLCTACKQAEENPCLIGSVHLPPEASTRSSDAPWCAGIIRRSTVSLGPSSRAIGPLSQRPRLQACRTWRATRVPCCTQDNIARDRPKLTFSYHRFWVTPFDQLASRSTQRFVQRRQLRST